MGKSIRIQATLLSLAYFVCPALVQAGTVNSAPSTNTIAGIALPHASKLLGVPDVNVRTPRGTWPHLPVQLAGLYPPGVNGPKVRVIWPAPTNNSAVLTTGVFTVTGRVPGTAFQPKATVTVTTAPKRDSGPTRQLEPFALRQVTLLPDSQQRPTLFLRHRDKFRSGLAASNPDDFLYMFRDAFGQPQPAGAKPLGVWDSQTTKLRGHATGHYLSAIAQAYASSGDDPELQAKFRQKLDQLIATLHSLAAMSGRPAQPGGPCQPDPRTVPFGPGKVRFDSELSSPELRTDYWNWGRGFISAYPPDQFIMLEQGAVYGSGPDQIWAPYYTLHKLLAGLLDAYELAGNRDALVVAEGMGRWVTARLSNLPPATRSSMWNRYIAGEFGGMNETFARLSRLTGQPEFLASARLFDNTTVFFGDAQHTHGLAKNVDTLRGRHANQHIPQMLGALATYRESGDPAYWRIAENFWAITTASYAYNIGGVAGARNPDNPECFIAEPDTLFANGFAAGGQNETCATYNLLKLSRELFLYTPDARYADYYERALFNHILGSVAEHDAGNTYHVPLNPGARKQFTNARMDGFTCCNGTALESATKFQDSIYFRSADQRELYVNLFVPSRLDWTERGVTVLQQTDFPYSNRTRLTVRGEGKFTLHLRVPGWATHGGQLQLNGRPQKISATPGTYHALERRWRSGDVVEFCVPLDFWLSPVVDRPQLASIFYGPVLLAAQEAGARDTWRPITLNEADLSRAFTGDASTLRFSSGEVEFRPFYESFGRYSAYLDVTLK
jgi:DUF1680 family protein